MIILVLRTDKPEAEIGIYDDQVKKGYETWVAHRQLAETLHIKAKALIDLAHVGWKDIGGVVIFAGPGSFTGLRLGFSFVNALAYSNGATIFASHGDNWVVDGIVQLQKGNGVKSAIPNYGMPAHITQQKK